MKSLMKEVKACKEKQLAVLFLLTVLTLFLAPGVKAHAASTPIDPSTLTAGAHLVKGDILSNPRQSSGSSFYVYYYNPLNEAEWTFDQYTGTIPVAEKFNTSEWKVRAVSADRIELVYWPLGTDVCVPPFGAGDKVRAGDILNRSDPTASNEYWVQYTYLGGTGLDTVEITTEEIRGNYTVKSLQSVQEWTVTDIAVSSVTTVILDAPQTGRNASTVALGDVLDARTPLYTPYSKSSDPWYMNYQDPNGGSPIREPITATDFIVEKHWGGEKWEVYRIIGKNIYVKMIPNPAPGSVDASTLQPGWALRRGDKLYSPDLSSPWYFVYRSPDGSADFIREKIITDYTVTDAYGKEEWTVVETDASEQCIYAEAPGTPHPAQGSVDASTLQPGRALRRGNKLYSPNTNSPWYFVYRSPDGSADFIREEIITDYTVTDAYGKEEWTVVETDASEQCIYAEAPGTPHPAQGSVDASSLQPGRALRRGDKLYSPNTNSPWYFIYRSPDGSADFLREEIITDYTVTDAYGKEEWTVVETDASAQCIYAEAPTSPDPVPDPGPEPAPEPDVPAEPEKHAGPCHHEYEWETQREATATTAGLMYYKCRKCGYVAQVLEISGFSAFLEDTAKSVRAAEPDATVTVDTNMWTCFNRSVIDALTERPDVTMNITYKYEGKYYTTGIPAGADLSGLIDENGYCGFRYLDQVFGGAEVER